MAIALTLSAPSSHDHQLVLSLAPLASRAFVSFNVLPSSSYFTNSREARSQRSVDSLPLGNTCPPVYFSRPTFVVLPCIPRASFDTSQLRLSRFLDLKYLTPGISHCEPPSSRDPLISDTCPPTMDNLDYFAPSLLTTLVLSG
jgi:hypothetical protein